MVTYAHTDHKDMNNLQVFLHDKTIVYAKIDFDLDVVWLKAKTNIQIERVSNHLPYEGELYFQLGFSATDQHETPFSVQFGIKYLILLSFITFYFVMIFICLKELLPQLNLI